MRRFAPPAPSRSVSVRLLSAVAIAAGLALTTISAQIPSRNINMVAGTVWPFGDPFLQRQNEPSIAASTRNPLHLLGGSNDYRTVDLPGLPGDEIGDAWLGLYKSFDGGQRWTSTLLPGYPQDFSAEGVASPIKGYGAGADPVVRAGTNGLIYYAGLVFDRSNPATPTVPGKSAIFVARFIDNNNKEAGDTFAYLGTRALQTDPGGGTGNFLDKPWLAVDIPRDSARCTITTPGEKGPITQSVPAGPLYVAYTLKSKDSGGDRYDVMFTRSGDCGGSWTTPVKINNPADRANQGATIAIDPKSGDVYVAWRRFDLNGDNDAIMTTKFNLPVKKFDPPGIARRYPKGKKKGIDPVKFFTRGGVSSAIAAAQLAPFDQGTSPINELLAFRTNAYPSLTVDDGGRVYMAWSERGFDPIQSDPVAGDARIMLATTTNGKKWTDAEPVALEGQLGHQIMPTIAFSGGKLMLVYYDLRETRAQTFSKFIDDVTARPSGKRHTIDLRASLASPGSAPVFAPSVRVSDYLEGPRTPGGPNEPLQVNPPNLPMFMQGTAPFMGDYIDVTAAPQFVTDARGRWVYNTAAGATPPIFHAVWTDNRDVRPPRFDTNGDGNPWNDYTPPGTFGGSTSLADPTKTVAMCVAGNAGSRNQNIYTARITGGLHVGSPGNNKTLSQDLQRSFVIFAQNTTETAKTFRLTIAGQPPGGRASFQQFPLPPYTAASPPPLTVIEAIVPRRSTVSRTVYVTSSDPHARITINVTEIGSLNGATVTGGLGSAIVLNPDIDNPDIDNPDIDNPDIDNPDIDNAEVRNPDIDNPDIDNPDIDNPDIDNPDIDNPDIDNVRIANPDIDNPDIDNPDIDNPDIDNPDIDNPDIDNPDIDNSSLMTDVTWNLTNTGNTTAAYNVNLFFAQTNFKPTVKTQLILHRIYKTPVALNCELKVQTRNVLVANVPNPQLVLSSTGQVSNPNDPAATNATIYLVPGEGAKITFRMFDPDPQDNEIVIVTNADGSTAKILAAFVPNEDVTLVVQQQSVNSEEAEAGVTEAPIVAQFPSPEAVNDSVSTTYRTPVTLNVLANDSVAFGSTKVHTVHPDGLGQNMGGGAGEMVYLPGTKLIYAANGRGVGVIDPNGQQVVGRLPGPATWTGAGYGLASARANIVYFRSGGNAATNSALHAVDGRPGSATYHQFLALPPLEGAVQTFTIDEVRQRLFVVHGNPVAPAQSMVSTIDINPSSETFHQVIQGSPVAFPPGTRASMLAVNQKTGRLWLALTASTAGANGTYYLDPAADSPVLVRVTGVSGGAVASLAVNDAQNLVFSVVAGPAIAGIPAPFQQSAIRIDVINGATGALMFQSAPAAELPIRFGTPEDRIVVHRPTGKVFVRSIDHVLIVDGMRTSPTFGSTTVVEVGHEEGSSDLVVDEVTDLVATANSSSLFTNLIDVHTNAVALMPNLRASAELALDPVGHRLFRSTGSSVETYGVPGFNNPILHGQVSVFPEVTELLVNPATNKAYVGTTVFGATMNISSGSGFAGPIPGQPHQAGRYTFGARHDATNMFFVGNSESNAGGVQGKPGSVLVIDGATDTATDLIASINSPFGAGMNQNTGQLYMAGLSLNTADGQIGVHQVADLEAGVVVADTSAIVRSVVNGNPQRIGFGRYVAVNHATNRVYFAVQNGSDTALAFAEPTAPGVAPVVQPIDISALLPPPYDEGANFRVDVVLTHAVLNRIYLGLFQNTPTPAYLVIVLDGTTHQMVSWFAGGGHSRLHTASWLALNEATNALYVVNFNSDNVVRLNAAGAGQLAALATTSLPDGPSATAINVTANRLYVSNVNDKSITALKGDTLEILSTVKLPLMALFMEVDEVESRIYTSGGNTPDESGTMVVTDVLGQLGSNVSVTAASNGTLGTTAVNADFSVTYTPNPGLMCESSEGCTDSFTYTVSNQGGTAQGTVTVYIVPAVSRPVAVNDNYVATTNQNLLVGAPGLLANDIGISDGAVTIDTFGEPQGTLVANHDGSFTYEPPAGFTGQDVIGYIVTVNGVASNTGNIFITVQQPVSVVVTNTNDAGPGSLRQAIQVANSESSASPIITFNIPGEGTRVIQPLSGLPLLTVPMTIDGYTQPGSSPNTLAVGTNAVILIELRGNAAGGTPAGLNVVGGGTTIKGLAIGGFGGAGIHLDGLGGNIVHGNFLGINAQGTVANPNNNGVIARSPNNVIGGATFAARNLISGNTNNGVRLTVSSLGTTVNTTSAGTAIVNNLIGTTSNGLQALANTFAGVSVSVPNVTIGGISALERNVISGNGQHGVNTFASVSNNTVLSVPSNLVVQGNYVGVTADGSAALPNIGHGVLLNGATSLVGGVAGTTVGACTGACNVISGNTTNGVGLYAHYDNPLEPTATMGTVYSAADGSSIMGNFIGLNAAGTAAIPNGPAQPTFSAAVNVNVPNVVIGGPVPGAGNVISGNNGAGINLGFANLVTTGAIVRSAAGAVIRGNFIGVSPDGMTARGNGNNGIALSPDHVTIGGPNAGDRNIISGNGASGVNAFAGLYDPDGAGPLQNLPTNPPTQPVALIVTNNYVGTNATGMAAIPNLGTGLNLSAPAAAVRTNLISGNTGGGLNFGAHSNFTTGEVYSSAANAVAEGNLIGVDVTGNAPLPNTSTGVFVSAPNVRIGGSTPAQRNVIGTNRGNGIFIGSITTASNEIATSGVGTIVQGNYVGVSADGNSLMTNLFSAINSSAAMVTIGGPEAGQGNLVAGGINLGRQLAQIGAVINAGGNSIVQGNTVGLNAAQTGSLTAPSSGDGVSVQSAGNQILQNVIAGNGVFPALARGISLEPFGNNNVVRGNIIGTNPSGDAGLGNSGSGINIGGSSNNTIGGPQPGDRNIISGNRLGVTLNAQSGETTSGNRLFGNYIGVKADGLTALPNAQNGVSLFANVGATVSGNFIGGSGPGEGNLISGNGFGVTIQGTGTTNNTIAGNLIGTTASGLGALPNSSNGIFIADASDNTIGGTGLTDGNLIAFNTHNGILMPTGVRNRILGNRIHSNTFLGIDLNSNGVTANDAGDGDSGANFLQNFPVLSNASNSHGATTRVDVNLTSFANGQYTLQFFANAGCDPSGHGEGQRLIGHFTGHAAPATSQLFLNEAVAAGQFITATATDANGNTSEFSACAEVDPANPIVTNTNDSGPGSLRQAIINANAAPDANTIAFNLGGAPPFVITLGTALPIVINPLTIDGTTQPGYSGTPLIEIDGVNTGPASNGLYFITSDSVVRALAISRFGLGAGVNDVNGAGVIIVGDRNRVESCYVGLRPDGATASANRSDGIWIHGDQNVVLNNTISGNGRNGITIVFNDSDANIVRGNKIGTNPAGTTAVPNGFHGIDIFEATSTVVGGTSADDRNVISGNGTTANFGVGVRISGPSNQVSGNLIGTDVTGTSAIPNSAGGIFIFGPTGSNNVIGATVAGSRNVISGNGIGFPFEAVGVKIGTTASPTPTGNQILGNYIGVDASGTVALGNNSSGVVIQGTSNFVGGSSTNSGNVISGNGSAAHVGHGIHIGSLGGSNQVLGNLIGTNAAGTATIPNRDHGIQVLNSTDNIIGGALPGARNVVSGNGIAPGIGAGIQIDGTSANTQILGNYIGVDITGTDPLGNRNYGIVSFAAGTIIGGAAAGEGNVISANGVNSNQIDLSGGTATIRGNLIGFNASGTGTFADSFNGIVLRSSGNIVGGAGNARNIISGHRIGIQIASGNNNTVVGNRIGTNPAGTAAVGNVESGVLVFSANNTIGGTDAADANLISGNSLAGVFMSSPNATGNVVFNNLIGTDIGGTQAIPNGTGVLVQNGASNNTIGGTIPPAGNRIANNTGAGVVIGNAATGNRILFNAITANGLLGIDLVADGNNNQQPAVLTAASNTPGQNTTVTADLPPTATGFTLQFFANLACDATGGEGDRIVGHFTGVSGRSQYTLTEAVPTGQFISATITDSLGNTSEFAVCTPVGDSISSLVTNTNDSGAGSLRQAIIDANATPGAQTINFNIPGAGPGSPAVINLASALPAIADAVVIDGASQPGFAGQPIIEINGTGVPPGPGASGLTVATSVSSINSLSITGFPSHGIHLNGGVRSAVLGSWIGVRADGTMLGNGSMGIYVVNSSGNQLSSNVVGGNGFAGVYFFGASDGNQVQNNRIGTNPAGTAAYDNTRGVGFEGSSSARPTNNTVANNLISGNLDSGIRWDCGNLCGAVDSQILNNTIGLSVAGEPLPNGSGLQILTGPGTVVTGNTIAGNTGAGITINEFGTPPDVFTPLTIQGNRIGTDSGGALARPNGIGIRVFGAAVSTLVDIGGPAGAANTIRFNTGAGIAVNGTRVMISENRISENGGLGIDLGPVGVTANDPGDGDEGEGASAGNHLQNFPTLTFATNSAGPTTRVGFNTLDFGIGGYDLRFYSQPSCDVSGHGEGAEFRGLLFGISSGVTTTIDLNALVPVGHAITATATDPAGNTSEFSACVTIDPFVALTPNPFGIVTNTSAPMTVTLSHPAGVGGQTVTLVSNDPVATIEPSIVIAEGASAGTATITTGSAAGAAIITASAAGFQDGTANVNVILRGMTLGAPSSLVGVGRSLTGTITLGQPAPAGGLAVNLVSGNTNFVTVSPAIVTIAQGGTTGTFTIDGVASGPSTITASATGASDATLTITATTSSLISMGNPPVVAPGQTAGVAVSLGIEAPAGGVTISFVSSDTNVMTITPSVFVPAGQRTPAANPQITGVVPGTAFLTASAPGFAPDTRTANVTLTLSFTPASGFAVIAGRTSNITLNLSSPAPAGGLMLNTSIDNTALATVPPTVTVAAGSTSVAVPVSGVAVGTTTVRASGTGIAPASAPVRVDPTPPITIGNTTIGKDLQASLSGSLGLAAPVGGVVVTITSLDPSKVLLATSATAAGSASITRTVNAGSSFIASFWVQALVGSGTAQIETTADGYVTDTSTVTFQPSGFVLNASNFSTNTRAADTAVRVDAALLNPSTLRWVQTQDLRAGLTANVSVTSTNPAVGAIVGSPAVFSGGDSFKTVSFNPDTVGSTTISVSTPAGFSTPTDFQSITATVADPAITLGNTTVGKDLQAFMSGSLGAPAPPGNLQVTIRSLDISKLLLSTSATAVGSGSITLTVLAGSSSIPGFYVQALADTDTVDFEATAPGYATDVSTVTLNPSGFVLNASNFSTNTFAANTTIRVDAARLNPLNLRWVTTQDLRGGLNATVIVTSSDTRTGTIIGSPAAFTGGDSFQTVSFDPAQAGTTTISVSRPAGFSTPSDFQSVTATVTAPNITIGNATVGRDLQMLISVSLGATPPNPVTVTVRSTSPTIATVTRDGTVAGGTSVTFTDVTTSFVGQLYVQGLALGTTTLEVEAAGYNTGISNVTVDPSGFVLNSNNFTTNTFAPDVTIRVDAARLNPTTLRWVSTQELRAGLTVDAEVTSSDTNVGTIIGSPATINGGDSFSNAIKFDARTAGQTTVSIATPPGFTTPADFQSLTATVTAPDITIGNATVGRDLQTLIGISLGATPPNPVTVTVRSNSPTLATLTRDGTVAGGTSVTFTNVTSTFVGQIYVQGRAPGTTTLTVEAAGYNDGTSNVTVDPSGFVLNSNDFTTNTFAANTTIRVDAARLNPTTLAWVSTQELRGGLTVNIPVTSSNTAVGTIVGSPATIAGGDSFKSVAFDPAALGTTTISAGTPPGFSTPSTFQSITATVNAPTITMGNAVVGRDLQMSLFISLESAPPSPVTVTVTSADDAIGTITSDPTVAGGTSVTFTNVSGTNVGSIVVQGRALGATTLTVQALGYTPDTSSVTVDPSGFVLNMSDITTTAGAANTSLRIDATRLNPATLNWAQSQDVRGGLNLNVTVTSSNTAVGTIVGSPVAFAPGDSFKNTAAFDPAAAGSTTIAVTTPAGFTTPSNFQSIAATVNP